LIGFSKKQIIKLPSSFEKEKLQIEDEDISSKKFLDDMEAVRKYFVTLNLNKIVERIDKDLGNE
jgi:hypothetical protein